MKRVIMAWVILVIVLATPILGQPDGSMTDNIPVMPTWTDPAVPTWTYGIADQSIIFIDGGTTIRKLYPIDNLYQALGGPTKTTEFFIVEYEGYDWNPCSGNT